MKTYNNILDWASNTKPVPVLETLTPEAIKAHGAKPFVGRDPDIVRACEPFSPEMIRERLGTTEVKVYISANGKFPGGQGPYDSKQYLMHMMPLSELMDRQAGLPFPRFFNEQEHYYLYGVRDVNFADLDKVDVTRFLTEDIDARQFWLSVAGATTPIHYDMYDNYLVQLMGRKRVLIWAPDCYTPLEFNPIGTLHDRQSRVDSLSADGSAWPAVAGLPAYVHDLAPGDMLHIPYAWPHFVYTEEFSASLNFWWNPAEVAELLSKLPLAESANKQTELIEHYVGTHRPELKPLVGGFAADGSLNALLGRVEA